MEEVWRWRRRRGWRPCGGSAGGGISRLPVEERVGVVLQVQPLHVVVVPQARGRQPRRDDAADDGGRLARVEGRLARRVERAHRRRVEHVERGDHVLGQRLVGVAVAAVPRQRHRDVVAGGERGAQRSAVGVPRRTRRQRHLLHAADKGRHLLRPRRREEDGERAGAPRQLGDAHRRAHLEGQRQVRRPELVHRHEHRTPADPRRERRARVRAARVRPQQVELREVELVRLDELRGGDAGREVFFGGEGDGRAAVEAAVRGRRGDGEADVHVRRRNHSQKLVRGTRCSGRSDRASRKVGGDRDAELDRREFLGADYDRTGAERSGEERCILHLCVHRPTHAFCVQPFSGRKLRCGADSNPHTGRTACVSNVWGCTHREHTS